MRSILYIISRNDFKYSLSKTLKFFDSLNNDSAVFLSFRIKEDFKSNKFSKKCDDLDSCSFLISMILSFLISSKILLQRISLN